MAEPGINIAEYTVSEIAFEVKRAIEDQFGYVRVRGEISGYRGAHASGHAYFSLKDERARIEAVIWKTTFQKLKVRPEEGMEVIASGKLTTFPGASKYQIVIESIAPAGVGALMALVEERRRKLAAEGLFDEARKRPLPFLPRRIGVVTSPTGAVIRDILHRLADRFPVDVLVWPVRVQGEGSAAEVAAAIEGFGRMAADGAARPGAPVRPDVIIVARGGGSLEDLWGFNDEAVVRAVAASPVPVISAVGHETDWTLIDHVADRRAPTPTAAAEMAVPVRSECLAAVAGNARRAEVAMARGLEQRRAALRSAARALPDPGELAAVGRQRLDVAGMRLDGALGVVTGRLRQRLGRLAGALSPAGLARYARHERERAQGLALRLDRATVMALVRRGERFRQLARGLSPMRVEGLARDARRRLDGATLRFERAGAADLARRAAALAGAAKLLATLGYRSVLARGYAVVRDAGDRPVRSATALASGDGITVEFADGRIAAVTSGAVAPPAKRPRRRKAAEGQADLF